MMKGTFILLAVAAVFVAAYPATEESSESNRGNSYSKI